MRFCSAQTSLMGSRTCWLAVILTLSSVTLAAQLTSVYPEQQSPAKHALGGTVVNSATGEPIPYALVQVDQNVRLADQNGNFEFDGLTSSTVTIQAHKPGFFGENELGDNRSPMVANLSDRPTTLKVPLVPEAVITGHVENSDGEPLGGLPVRLRFNQIMNGRRVLQQFGHRQTDEDGNFRIADLRPGTYYVEVGPNSRARPVGEEDLSGNFEVVPAEYYPGVREISVATPLRLAAGQQASVELSMKRVPAFRVAGVITGTFTNGGLYFSDSDGDRVNMPIRLDHRTGRFQAFPVPAGSYRLRFNGRDADGEQLFADVPLNINGNIPELHVGVERTTTIPVEYQTDFVRQNPAPGPSMPTEGVSSGIGHKQIFYGQVRLTSRKPPYQQYFANRERQDGPTVIRGLEPGTYDVEVDPSGATYVASVSCGGLNLLAQPLVIAEGGDPQPIQVMLRDDGASLNGTVQSADGARPGLVLMVPDGDAQTPPRQVWVDGSGKFQAQSLAPGSYEVLAFDRLEGVEFRNREVLSAYLSHAAHVTLSPEQQAKVTVDLIHTTP
jgi:hypothetical protein